MRDPTSELPGGRALGVHLEGPEVAGEAGVGGEVGVADGPASGGPLAAEREVFEKDRVQGAASIKRWSCQ